MNTDIQSAAALAVSGCTQAHVKKIPVPKLVRQTNQHFINTRSLSDILTDDLTDDSTENIQKDTDAINKWRNKCHKKTSSRLK